MHDRDSAPPTKGVFHMTHENRGPNMAAGGLHTRRDAARAGAAAITAAIAGKVATAAEPRQWTMVIDLSRCTGCNACAVACKAENGVRLGGFRSWVSEKEVGRYPDTKRLFLPRLCNHCRNPACLKVCPTGATHRRFDGIVAIAKDRCIGCRHCMGACPYGARYFNPQHDGDEEARFPARTHGTVDKCDLCSHRIDSGVVPACVNTCPAGARIFGDLADPASEVHRLWSGGETTGLLPELGMEPTVSYRGGAPGAFRT
jgi:tetrathionate reductase subunit B